MSGEPTPAEAGEGGWRPPTAPAGGAFARLLAALRIVAHNPSLSRLQSAQLVMTVAEYGQWIALLVYAYDEGGASAAGLVAVAQLIPAMFLSPVVSAHGQRYGPVRLLEGAYLALTLTLGVCAASILLGGPSALVYASAIAFTVAVGVASSTHNVIAPLVVRHPDELTAANAATGWVKGLGSLAGPAIAGVVMAVEGPGLALAVLALVSLPMAPLAHVRPLRSRAQGEEGGEQGGLRDLIEAARVILVRPNTRTLLAYRGGASAIEGAIDLLTVLLAVEILKVGAGAAGYLTAAFGAGGLVGASLAFALAGRHLARPLIVSTLLGSAALAALALASTVAVAVVLLVCVGAARAVQSIASQTLLQRSTPLDVIVCAFALVESMGDAGLAFGSLAVPLLVSAGGPEAAFVGMALIAPLVVLLTLRRVRRIDHEASIPVVEMGLLRNLSLFASLPAAPLETLAREAAYEDVAAGQAIVREGEEGDRYYAITAGAVRVTKGGREIRRMARGEGFGEIALLHSVSRTATVTAEEPAVLLCVGREAFLAALGASSKVNEAAGRLADELIAHAA